MKTAENIQKVALVLFLVIGVVHIISGLMFSNGFLLPHSLWINRVMDIPFALMGLAFAFSTIYKNADEKNRKTVGIIFGVIGLLIFAALLYINLLVPDKAGVLPIT